MPWKLRMEYTWATYPPPAPGFRRRRRYVGQDRETGVMARGNQGQAIFRDDRDRRRFLETLGEACDQSSWRIPAWRGQVGRLQRKPGGKLQPLKRPPLEVEVEYG
jgi:hypothetical protein